MGEPAQKPCRNALTVDWEDWYHGLLDRPDRWEDLTPRLPATTGRLLDLLAKHGARATFFILGHAAERHPETVREIRRAGHEIASHGYGHQFVYSHTPESFRRDTIRSVNFLQDLLSEPIWGYRASTFTITAKTLWALDILEELGFRYDSSIFPVKNAYYGIPSAPRHPHRLEGKRMWEFPPTVARWGGRNIPVAGGFYLRILPISLFRSVYRRMNREGKPVVFYIHPWELDPDQPRRHYSMFWRLVRFYGLGRVTGKLEELLTRFRWCSIRDLLEVQEMPT